MAVLHIICGLPGSGKSTLARQLESRGEGVRLTPDEWLLALGAHLYDASMRDRVEKLPWTLAQKLLATGTSVILENGFWSRREREEIRATAITHGAETRLHYLEVGLDELRRRIVIRNSVSPPKAFVNPDDLVAWSAIFEPPAMEEL